jgi:circadian clock protein KaiC
MHELISYLNQKGVVTFLIYTQHGLIDSMQTEVDVSYLADTVILLRYLETDGESVRSSLLSNSASGPMNALCGNSECEDGVDISETLSSFRGMLTGDYTTA